MKLIEDRENIRRQDAVSVFSDVISNPDGFERGFHFLQANFERVAD